MVELKLNDVGLRIMDQGEVLHTLAGVVSDPDHQALLAMAGVVLIVVGWAVVESADRPDLLRSLAGLVSDWAGRQQAGPAGMTVNDLLGDPECN